MTDPRTAGYGGSLDEVPEAPWVHGMSIGEVLREQARRRPDGEALVFRDRGFRATYARYDELVDEVALGLLSLGIRPGHHVAVWATNCPEWTLLQMATARLGAVLVTVNPAYRVRELRYTLKQADVRVLFLIDRFKDSDYFRMVAEACPELGRRDEGEPISTLFPELRWIVSLVDRIAPGMLAWTEMLERPGDEERALLATVERGLDPEAPINLQYTSGTTGLPKGALLSHRNLLLNAYYVGACQRFTPEDRVCVPVPFYHCFGCVLGVLCALVHGATVLVPAEYFEPAVTLDCLEEERATAVYGVPTMFIAQLEHPSFEDRDLSTLRTGIMAGSPCPMEVMKRVIDRMGAREITIAYGLTEASPVITQTRVDDPLELRVDTVGRPLPGVEVKIVDPTGRELPDGEPGELCARGHGVMVGYYEMPEATDECIDADGWLRTGDLAVRGEDGYYRITGRIKDMVIRGGENVYPREIEEFLYEHPKVEEVQVVGVPDPRLGEELCAWIKLRRGAEATREEIRAFCEGRIAHYKVPRYVDFVDEFPRTVTGKIQKYRIREEAVRRLGLQA